MRVRADAQGEIRSILEQKYDLSLATSVAGFGKDIASAVFSVVLILSFLLHHKCFTLSQSLDFLPEYYINNLIIQIQPF